MRTPAPSPRALAALRTIRRRFGIHMTPDEIAGLDEIIGAAPDFRRSVTGSRRQQVEYLTNLRMGD